MFMLQLVFVRYVCTAPLLALGRTEIESEIVVLTENGWCLCMYKGRCEFVEFIGVCGCIEWRGWRE